MTFFYNMIYKKVQLIVKKCTYPDTEFWKLCALILYHWLQMKSMAHWKKHMNLKILLYNQSMIQPKANVIQITEVIVLAFVSASN